ncbi:MAG: SH3 domain-containing protein [Lachnospiraceae bacterium]|nr:SH3 domain-containing protein [Lachnospiraceae bacterium]
MKIKKSAVFLLCGMLAAGSCTFGTQAAFEQTVETAYNTAVQGQDALDGLDVTVKEKTVSSSTNVSANKMVSLKVSGIKGSSLKADIQVDTDEGTTKSYYQNGYYYTTTSEGEQKREMDRTAIWDMVNSEIYMNMTSNYLKMLYSETDGSGAVTYHFAATADTLGDYSKKLLEGSGDGQGIVVDALQGTMETNEQGSILKRSIQMIYTVTQGENEETFMVQTDAEFRQNGQAVTVALPDLSGYREPEPEKPVETITPLQRTVYTTDDVNVRAAGNLSAVILGGLAAGSGVTEMGYTSDGWIQIQYNGATGYIWGDYISTTRPVLTQNTSGTMYATASVNVRSAYSSDSSILGGLSKGQGIEITGKTNNNWIRVKYNGHIGYVYADYLSWSEPVVDTYVQNGYLSGTVTEASFGTLTIQRDDGQGTAVFNTVYAAMSLKDTIYTGDWVEVFYTGAGAPYTASQVNDYTRHTDADEARSVSVEGVVVACTPGTMELSGSDGIYRTFNITDTDIEMSDNLSEGQVVTVTWMSAANGAETRNIEALRIKG